jgi:hypothetical protein
MFDNQRDCCNAFEMQLIGNGLTNGLPVLASASLQCAMPRGPECQGILGQAQHPRDSPPILLTTFGPLQLLPLSQAEENPEGEMI